MDTVRLVPIWGRLSILLGVFAVFSAATAPATAANTPKPLEHICHVAEDGMTASSPTAATSTTDSGPRTEYDPTLPAAEAANVKPTVSCIVLAAGKAPSVWKLTIDHFFPHASGLDKNTFDRYALVQCGMRLTTMTGLKSPTPTMPAADLNALQRQNYASLLNACVQSTAGALPATGEFPMLSGFAPEGPAIDQATCSVGGAGSPVSEDGGFKAPKGPPNLGFLLRQGAKAQEVAKQALKEQAAKWLVLATAVNGYAASVGFNNVVTSITTIGGVGVTALSLDAIGKDLRASFENAMVEFALAVLNDAMMDAWYEDGKFNQKAIGALPAFVAAHDAYDAWKAASDPEDKATKFNEFMDAQQKALGAAVNAKNAANPTSAAPAGADGGTAEDNGNSEPETSSDPEVPDKTLTGDGAAEKCTLVNFIWECEAVGWSTFGCQQFLDQLRRCSDATVTDPTPISRGMEECYLPTPTEKEKAAAWSVGCGMPIAHTTPGEDPCVGYIGVIPQDDPNKPSGCDDTVANTDGLGCAAVAYATPPPDRTYCVEPPPGAPPPPCYTRPDPIGPGPKLEDETASRLTIEGPQATAPPQESVLAPS
jgi:hypothetical protein